MKIAFFFDGTGNNGNNSNLLREKKDFPCPKFPLKLEIFLPKFSPSYRNEGDKFGWNYKTNIFKLFEFYEGENKIYIEGIGTIFEKGDSFSHIIDCKPKDNEYSYKAKINKALRFLERKVVNNDDSEILIDVFGFSRGAALARFFINLVLENKNTDGTALSFLVKYKIKINFVGLFDTVVKLNYPSDIFKLDVSDENLNRVNKIIHFCAMHEARENFPLTKVKPFSNLLEISLPGAHGDIGGGYPKVSKESNTIDSFCHIYSTDVPKMKKNYKWSWLFEGVADKEKFCKARSIVRTVDNKINVLYAYLMAKLYMEFNGKDACEFENMINDFENGDGLSHEELVKGVLEFKENFKARDELINSLSYSIHNSSDFRMLPHDDNSDNLSYGVLTFDAGSHDQLIGAKSAVSHPLIARLIDGEWVREIF